MEDFGVSDNSVEVMQKKAFFEPQVVCSDLENPTTKNLPTQSQETSDFQATTLNRPRQPMFDFQVSSDEYRETSWRKKIQQL